MKKHIGFIILITLFIGWVGYMVWYTWDMTGGEKLSDPVCWLSTLLALVIWFIFRKKI